MAIYSRVSFVLAATSVLLTANRCTASDCIVQVGEVKFDLTEYDGQTFSHGSLGDSEDETYEITIGTGKTQAAEYLQLAATSVGIYEHKLAFCT